MNVSRGPDRCDDTYLGPIASDSASFKGYLSAPVGFPHQRRHGSSRSVEELREDRIQRHPARDQSTIARRPSGSGRRQARHARLPAGDLSAQRVFLQHERQRDTGQSHDRRHDVNRVQAAQ